jgi:hypothetical protein
MAKKSKGPLSEPYQPTITPPKGKPKAAKVKKKAKAKS